MSSRRQSWLPLRVFLFALMVIPPISFLAASSWLKQQPDERVLLLSGIAGTVTIGASFLLAILHDRNMDEWHRSNTRFSTQWGWTAGASLVSFLLLLPVCRDWIVSVVADWSDVSDPSTKVVILAFTFGFIAVILMQLICTAVLSTGWALWKSRRARDPS
jgi:formate/nitrite transporter FocA (FNT family)